MNQEQLNAISYEISQKMDELLLYFHIELGSNNKSYYGCCPIHDGDNGNAFSIIKDSIKHPAGTWGCWTHFCHKTFTSSPIGLIRALLSRTKYNWKQDGDVRASFPETLQFIEKFLKQKLENIQVGIEEYEKKKWIKDQQSMCIEEIKIEQIFTREHVRNSGLRIPSPYFLNRGYTEEILTKYDIGDCVLANKEMAHRAVVPVYDANYKYMIGCSGRSINGLLPKWKHGGLFGRDNLMTAKFLYNYWFAKEHILKSGEVILVESPGNVWRLEEAGIHNSVCTFGASLKDGQRALLDGSGALKLIVCYDNDPNEVGQKAAEKIKKDCGRIYNIEIIIPTKNDIGDMSIEEVKRLFNTLRR